MFRQLIKNSRRRQVAARYAVVEADQLTVKVATELFAVATEATVTATDFDVRAGVSVLRTLSLPAMAAGQRKSLGVINGGLNVPVPSGFTLEVCAGPGAFKKVAE